MSSKNTHARDSFDVESRRVSGMLAKTANWGDARVIELIGTSLVASQYGDFADQLAALTDSVEVLLKGDKNVSIKRELAVPEVALNSLGSVFLRADGAMRVNGVGKKDRKLLDTYRVPVVLDVAALKDPAGFVSEMRVEIDRLYAAGVRLLVSK